jgi:hypothetical protein
LVIKFTNALPHPLHDFYSELLKTVKPSLALNDTDSFVAIGIRLEPHGRDNGPNDASPLR